MARTKKFNKNRDKDNKAPAKTTTEAKFTKAPRNAENVKQVRGTWSELSISNLKIAITEFSSADKKIDWRKVSAHVSENSGAYFKDSMCRGFWKAYPGNPENNGVNLDQWTAAEDRKLKKLMNNEVEKDSDSSKRDNYWTSIGQQMSRLGDFTHL